MNFFEVFFLLMIAHAVCDFALQNDYIAQAKNRNTALGKDVWFMVLPAHGLIHAGGVYLVTQSAPLAFFQFIVHTFIDFVKCEGKISYIQDQALHVLTMLYIALVVASPTFLMFILVIVPVSLGVMYGLYHLWRKVQ